MIIEVSKIESYPCIVWRPSKFDDIKLMTLNLIIRVIYNIDVWPWPWFDVIKYDVLLIRHVVGKQRADLQSTVWFYLVIKINRSLSFSDGIIAPKLSIMLIDPICQFQKITIQINWQQKWKLFTTKQSDDSRLTLTDWYV